MTTRTVKSPPKLSKNGNIVVAAMMASRFRSLPFKTVKQMEDFKKELIRQIDGVILTQKEAWATSKQKAALAKKQRAIAQAEVCGSFARAQLKLNDIVSFRKVKGKYTVIKLEAAGIMCVPVTLIEVNGGTMWDPHGNPSAFEYQQLEKICHEGKWLDVYKLASGM